MCSYGAVKAREKETMIAKENAVYVLVRLSQNKEGESDFASSEASRRRGTAPEEEHGDCAKRAMFGGEGE